MMQWNTPLWDEYNRVKADRDLLLAACEQLCAAIRLKDTSMCASYAMASLTEENMTEEYIEAHWIEHVAACLGDAYRAAVEVMERVL